MPLRNCGARHTYLRDEWVSILLCPLEVFLNDERLSELVRVETIDRFNQLPWFTTCVARDNGSKAWPNHCGWAQPQRNKARTFRNPFVEDINDGVGEVENVKVAVGTGCRGVVDDLIAEVGC